MTTTAGAGRSVVDVVRDRMNGLGAGETKVLTASVRLTEDSTGQVGLKVTLTLPAPRGRTWDAESLLRLRREVQRLVYETTRERGDAFEGATTVDVTAVDASGDDVALEETPEPGEATGDEA